MTIAHYVGVFSTLALSSAVACVGCDGDGADNHNNPSGSDGGGGASTSSSTSVGGEGGAGGASGGAGGAGGAQPETITVTIHPQSDAPDVTAVWSDAAGDYVGQATFGAETTIEITDPPDAGMVTLVGVRANGYVDPNALVTVMGVDAGDHLQIGRMVPDVQGSATVSLPPASSGADRYSILIPACPDSFWTDNSGSPPPSVAVDLYSCPGPGSYEVLAFGTLNFSTFQIATGTIQIADNGGTLSGTGSLGTWSSASNNSVGVDVNNLTPGASVNVAWHGYRDVRRNESSYANISSVLSTSWHADLSTKWTPWLDDAVMRLRVDSAQTAGIPTPLSGTVTLDAAQILPPAAPAHTFSIQAGRPQWQFTAPASFACDGVNVAPAQHLVLHYDILDLGNSASYQWDLVVPATAPSPVRAPAIPADVIDPWWQTVMGSQRSSRFAVRYNASETIAESRVRPNFVENIVDDPDKKRVCVAFNFAAL